MTFPIRTLLLASAAALGVTAAAQAAELKEIGQIAVKLDAKLQGFDIGWVDPATDLYVLTSRGSLDPKDKSNPGNVGLLIFDAAKETLLRIAPGFTVPRGVITVNNGTEAYVGDGDNNVKVVDLKAGKVVATIPAGAKKGGADELGYSPKDGVIAMALPDDEPPTLILISTKDRKIFAKVEVPGASDGFEQTVYSEVDGMFHTVIPELNKDPNKGGMITVDPKTGKQVGEIAPLDNCKPHGNAVGVGNELIIGCNYGQTKDKRPPVQMIFDIKANKVTATIAGIGGTDMSAADVALGMYYTASAGNGEGSALGVIDAKTHKLIQKIPSAGRAHSVAVNPKNHHVYLPEAEGQGGCGCIRVFAPM
jgi:DNA-binding beta-propeller fold protein YncE